MLNKLLLLVIKLLFSLLINFLLFELLNENKSCYGCGENNEDIVLLVVENIIVLITFKIEINLKYLKYIRYLEI